jgi:hypothetical protein
MRGPIAAFLLLAAAFPAGAGAMKSSGAHRHCRVVAGEQFLAGSGGGDALCADIKRAIEAAAPRAHYSAEIRAMQRARLSATLVVNGRTLPEQNFAVMDSGLDARTIHRFAQSLAEVVAKAAS